MRLHPDDATTHQGIRVTTPERTLIDMANVIEPEQLARAFREAQFLRRFDPAAMRRALVRKPSRAVAALMADFVQTRSPLEDLLLTIIDRHRIPRPRMQHPVLGHHLDFVWPEERVVVETDGWEGHGTRTAFQADRTLSNRLQLAGWLILRFTDADVKRRRERVAAEIRTALAARRGRLMDV
jgi:very-short-patch-repair endonuclease